MVLVTFETLDGLGAAGGGEVLGLVQELAALGLGAGESGDLEVLHLAADSEVPEHVSRRGEVELFFLGLDVLVLFGRFRFR